MASDEIVSCPATGCYFRGTILDCQGHVNEASTNATDLLKYLIRRTDITLLIRNIRTALSAGMINPLLRGAIEHLLDYTFGLVECLWDVEHLSRGPTKLLQWLILSHGGTQTWNKFYQIAQRDIRTATRMVENRHVGPSHPADLERLIKNLQIYSNMLVASVIYDRNGGPTMNGGEYEPRGAREHADGNIPTTNQERLAFRVERALRELTTKWNNLVASQQSIPPQGWGGEPQLQPGAAVEGENDGLAPGSTHHLSHQDNVGLSIPHEVPNEPIAEPKPPPPNEASKENPSNHLDLPNDPNIQEDMVELSSALLKALKLQEKLVRQLRNKDYSGAHTQPEDPTQNPKRQNNSSLAKGKAPESKQEIESDAEHKTSIEELGKSAHAEQKDNDKRKPVMSIDAENFMLVSGRNSPTGYPGLYTPPSENKRSGWFSDSAVYAHSPEIPPVMSGG